MLKVINKPPERRQWRWSGVFIVDFKLISHLFWVSLVDFEQVNVSWVCLWASSKQIGLRLTNNHMSYQVSYIARLI